jgi:DNA-binding SARP family transcriptional activator
MEYRILGPLEVSDGDDTLQLRGRRQRALLALLLLHANEVISSERLLDELWGAEPPESGTTALQVRISQLRKTLEGFGNPGVLVTRAPGYMLRIDDELIDARRFERLLGDGRAALARGEPAVAASILRDALALWRGPALADVAGEEFAQAEIARLDELRLAATEERIEGDLGSGRHDAVVGELEALVAANPLRERLRLQLMLALYRNGRQADALELYRETREMLVERLGIEPGPELRELHRRILTQDPGLEAPAPVGGPVPPAPAEAERKLVTVLFADLVGFTELVAGHDPERARAHLDRVHDAMAAEIESAGGTLEKFIGDAVVALFGAPVAQEDHAERALHAAVGLRRRLRESGEPLTTVRIGVASGEVIVGKAREGGSFATGVTVNTAERLQSVADPGEILVAARTARAARYSFEFGASRQVTAKGLPEPVEARPLQGSLSLSRRRHATVLVGRDRELGLVQAAYWRSVGERRPLLVTVVGEAGVGKSRLAHELFDWLGAETPTPLRRIGRCRSYGADTTYRPLADVLRQQLGLLESDSATTVASRLAGREILGLTLGLEAPAGVHPLTVGDRLCDAWRELLDGLVAERPAVVLLEDLHWADEPLLELVEALVGGVSGPLVVVATTRPELLDIRPGWGSDAKSAATLWLEPLSAADAELLLEELVAGELTEDVGTTILERAEGNPFFLEELLSSLVDQGIVRRGDAGSRRSADVAEPVVPDSVQAVLSGRMDLLPPDEKAALQAAAVIGRTFWRGPLLALLAGTIPDLDLLEGREFIVRRGASSLAGEREFAFRHALTRDVAYAGIPKARRAHLHAAFARWLEDAGRDRPEDAALVAHHYAEAVRPEDADLAWSGRAEELAELRRRALSALRHAAELAIARFALDEAIDLLRRALELETSPAARSALWRSIGRASALKHDPETFLAAMVAAGGAAPDNQARAEISAELAFETLIRSGMWNTTPATDFLGEAIADGLAHAKPWSAARAKALVAAAHAGDSHSARAAEEALAIADRLEDPPLRAYALDAQQVVAMRAGDYELAWEYSARRLTLLDRIDDPDLRADIVQNLVAPAVATCRFDLAREFAHRTDEITQPLTPHHRVHGVGVLVELEELLGRWQSIRALEARVRDTVAESTATPCVRGTRALLACAVAEAYLGDQERSLALEGEADALEPPGKRVLDALRVRLALLRGDLARARELLEVLLTTAGWYRHGHGTMVATLAVEIDTASMLGRRDLVEQYANRLGRPGTYLEPLVLRALGLVRDDGTLIRHALQRFESLGLDWHASETRSLL